MNRWGFLKKCYEGGYLSYIDLTFAAGVLKKLHSEQQEHAALLCVLFALSRQGHLALDLSPESLPLSLQALGVEDVATMTDLVLRGAATFPLQGIADNPEGVPGAWICRSSTYYYLQKNWVHESRILNSIERLSKTTPTLPLNNWTLDPRLNEAQKEAVAKAAQNTVSLLTGGPGTGKTFTASMLVHACLHSLREEHRKNFRIILTAPTGKAVAQLEGNLRKTIGPDTNVISGTLHALLGIRSSMYEEEIIPLLADLIVVDECSMIDVKVFSRLLASVPQGARLVLIGDKDQLPAVEAGSVFADLLDCGIYPVTQLVECLRSDRTEILTLARHIKEGSQGEALAYLDANADIDWMDLDVPQLLAQLWNRCKKRLPSFFVEPPQAEQLLTELNTFSILSCMRQGPLGVDAINRYFLNEHLKNAKEGDWWILPVMITRNDYELELFNGDLGWIVRKVTPDFTMRCFHSDDYALFYDRKGGFRQMSALALTSFEYSYCLSVHKSQGSEYDEVLILFPPGSDSFGREVLYTAVTRAKVKISLAGSKELFGKAIAISSRKKSGIAARLKITFAEI